MISFTRAFFFRFFKVAHFAVDHYAKVAYSRIEKGHYRQNENEGRNSHLLVIQKGVGKPHEIILFHKAGAYHNKCKIEVWKYHPEKGSCYFPAALCVKKQPVCHDKNGGHDMEEHCGDSRGCVGVKFAFYDGGCNDARKSYRHRTNPFKGGKWGASAVSILVKGNDCGGKDEIKPAHKI